MNEEHLVLGLSNDKPVTRESMKSGSIVVDEELGGHDERIKYSAIAMVEPPQENSFTLRRAYIRMKYWLLDRLSPCMDPGGVFEV